MVEVLKRCGDNLTRENVMKVVANMDFEINTYIPGIRIKTSPTDFYPIEQNQTSLKATRAKLAQHPIEEVGVKLRDMMPWIKKGALVDKTKN